MRCRNGALILAAALGTAAGQSNEQLLPASPEKEKMVKLCVGCHEIDLVVARRHTRAEWDGVVEDMVARGTKGSDEELAFVAEYLSKYLGKVNVNAATARELEDSLKIGEKDAKLIVDWRGQHGRFKSFEEVRKVPGIDASKLADKRGWMAFE